jgi:hypothetical protein
MTWVMTTSVKDLRRQPGNCVPGADVELGEAETTAAGDELDETAESLAKDELDDGWG